LDSCFYGIDPQFPGIANRESKIEKRLSFNINSVIRTGIIILFFLTPLTFYAWATTFTITKETIAQLILLFVGSLWLIKLLEWGDYHSLKSSLNLPIIVFLFILLISLFQTHTYYTSLVDISHWISFILIYFILISSFKEREWRKGLIIIILSSALISATYAIFQFYGLELPIWRKLGGRIRLFSTFGNPNYLSGYLAITFPLAFVLFCLEKKKSRQILLEILLALLYTGIFLTNIGGCIALFMGMVFIGIVFLVHQKNFLKENRLRLLTLILILSIISLIYSSPNPLNPTRRNIAREGISYTHLEHNSIQQRFLIWLSTIEMIKEDPLLGSGIGTFRIHYPNSQGKVLSLEKNKKYIPLTNKSINAHNDYLHLWAETGIIGLACFLWIVSLFYKKSFAYLKKVKREDKFLLIGLMGGMTAILIDALYSFPFHIIQNGMLFPFILALSTLIGEKRKIDKEKKCPLLLRRTIQISIVLLAVSLSILRIRIFVADTHLKTAEMMEGVRAYHLAEKEAEKALKINPCYGQAYSHLGRIKIYLGKYKEAIENLKRAEKNWIYVGLYNDLGYAYLKMRKIEEAKKFFKKNISLFPHLFQAYANLGSIFLEEGEKALSAKNLKLAEEKFDTSFIYYEQAKVLNPDFSLPFELAVQYYKTGILKTEVKKNSYFHKNLSQKETFSFFSRNHPYLDILRPIAKAGKPIYFKAFLYLEEEVILSAILKIRDKEERIIKTLNLEKEPPFSDNIYILNTILKEGLPCGEYEAIIRVKYGIENKRALAKEKFKITLLRLRSFLDRD